MGACWQTLRDGGLPLASARAGEPPAVAALAAAALDALGEGPTGREAEALGAYLRAWAQHWPATFAEAFGAAQAAVLARAEALSADDGRYLKLRRIALENLATVL